VVPDDAIIDWIFEASTWWLQSFGGFEGFARSTRIVTPTEEDFPVDLDLEGHELVEDYLLFAMEHAHMGDWPIIVAPDEPADVADVLRGMPHHMTSAPERVSPEPALEEGDPLPIPYTLAQLDEPIALVAQLARGLSHYLLYDARTPPPADASTRELVVDLGAAWLGFGVFLANSAFSYHQHESGAMVGWGYRRRGALTQLDVTFALAVVATLLDTPDGDVAAHLGTNPRGFFRSAVKHLHRHRPRDLDALRAIPAPPGGPYR